MTLVLFKVDDVTARALRCENTPPRNRQSAERLMAVFQKLGAQPKLSHPHLGKRNPRQRGYADMSVVAKDYEGQRRIVETLLSLAQVMEVTVEQNHRTCDVTVPVGVSPHKLRFM